MQKHVKWFFLPFLMIIVTFIFWGVGTNNASPVQIVAEVGPYTIDSQSYWRNYERMRDLYRNIFQGRLTEEMQKSLDLKNRTLEEMISQKILLIAAKENGIKVSDKELQEAIMSDPNFMRDGRFDRDFYLNTLRLNRSTAAQYEQLRREDMAADRIRKMVMEAFSPPPSTSKSTSEDKDKQAGKVPLLKRQQTALKAYIEGYKRKLKSQGEYTLNLDVISS